MQSVENVVPRLICYLNPFMPSGLFYLNSLDQSIYSLMGVWSVFITTMFIEMSVINANSVDPDQSPRSVTLILVYTVCQRPIYGTLGINGLRVHTDKCFVYYINFYSEEMFIFKFPYKYSEYYTLFLHLN